MRNTIEFLLKAGHVKRFHSVPTIKDNTVAHHSWGVAQLCWFMTYGKCRAELLAHALMHDVAELEVGDIPAPTKRIDTKVQDFIANLESHVLRSAGLEIPSLTPEEWRIFKVADCMDGMLNCIHECQMGNDYVQVPYKNFSWYIRDLLYATPRDQIEMMTFNTIREMGREVCLDE